MSDLFDTLKNLAQAHINTLRAIEKMNHRVCHGCRLPYPTRTNDPEENIKPFPICDACLEHLKSIYEKRGELK